MKKILAKDKLGEGIWEYVIGAPWIARAARPGQFIIIRLHERGERIPLTIVESKEEEGWIKMAVQTAGKTTRELNERFDRGDELLDVTGPLGEPSEIDLYGDVVVVGGGVGTAIALPVARALKEAGNRVTAIVGAQSADKLIYLQEMEEVSEEFYVTTDDGSAGEEGFTTAPLSRVCEGSDLDRGWAIGPVPMMKACAGIARETGLDLVVSLNSIMVDGTGMCGGCRVEVDGETKFACVDGPEFKATQVDFELLLQRLDTYQEEERCALEDHLAERKNGAEGREDV